MTMKKFKYIFVFISFFALTSCEIDSFSEEEQYILGDLNSPTALTVSAEIVGVSNDKPNGDGSGTVHFSASAEKALSYKFIYDGKEIMAPDGRTTINFAVNGTNTYVVTAVAMGAGGTTTSKSMDVTVYASFRPTEEFVKKLTNNSSKTWVLATDQGGYVGVGPSDSTWPAWYSADPFSRADYGSDDDEWTFTDNGLTQGLGGSFTHKTNGGCAVKFEYAGDVGGTSENVDDTHANFALENYSGSFTVTAPGGVETITFSGYGHIGLYTGTQNYTIAFTSDDSAELTTIDAHGRKWYYKIKAKE
jgi:hypothetical protein